MEYKVVMPYIEESPQVEELDLFKDWNPEMLGILVRLGDPPGTYERTDAHRELMSRIFLGKSIGPHSREHNRKISEALSGRTHSEDWIRKSAEAQRGRTQSREHRRKNSEANMGRLVSRETRNKIAETLRGRKVSWASRLRMSEVHTGIYPSEETRQKQSEVKIGHIVSKETREKISQTNKAIWANLSEEAYLSKTKNMGVKRLPTEPERLVSLYLERKFPGLWEYRGNKSPLPGVRKKPDFIRLDGKKEVIEVFGIYYHSRDEEPSLIAHYAKWGYKCIVIWQFDCYSTEDLDKILG